MIVQLLKEMELSHYLGIGALFIFTCGYAGIVIALIIWIAGAIVHLKEYTNYQCGQTYWKAYNERIARGGVPETVKCFCDDFFYDKQTGEILDGTGKRNYYSEEYKKQRKRDESLSNALAHNHKKIGHLPYEKQKLIIIKAYSDVDFYQNDVERYKKMGVWKPEWDTPEGKRNNFCQLLGTVPLDELEDITL